MMKGLKYGAAVLAALLLGACSESEVFYTAVYPVVRVEAVVTVPSPEPEPEPEPTPESRADEGGTTNPVIEEIEAGIVASAHVQAGGRYTLNFSKYNGGRAQIETATEAAAFFKTPGTNEVLIYCPEPEAEYSFTLSTYQDTDGRTKTVLVTDLTETYQALYPDAGITKAERRSYTSTNAN